MSAEEKDYAFENLKNKDIDLKYVVGLLLKIAKSNHERHYEMVKGNNELSKQISSLTDKVTALETKAEKNHNGVVDQIWKAEKSVENNLEILNKNDTIISENGNGAEAAILAKLSKIEKNITIEISGIASEVNSMSRSGLR